MADANNKAAKPSKWQGIKKEFSRITWPKKEALFKQSFAVIIITIILSIVIALVDAIIKSAMGLFI